MTTYEVGAEQVALTYRRMPPQTGGKGSYGHAHKTQEELYLVLSGTLQFKLDDEVIDVPARTAVRVAPEVVRSVWNEGPADVELVIASVKIDDPRGTRFSPRTSGRRKWVWPSGLNYRTQTSQGLAVRPDPTCTAESPSLGGASSRVAVAVRSGQARGQTLRRASSSAAGPAEHGRSGRRQRAWNAGAGRARAVGERRPVRDLDVLRLAPRAGERHPRRRGRRDREDRLVRDRAPDADDVGQRHVVLVEERARLRRQAAVGDELQTRPEVVRVRAAGDVDRRGGRRAAAPSSSPAAPRCSGGSCRRAAASTSRPARRRPPPSRPRGPARREPSGFANW